MICDIVEAVKHIGARGKPLLLIDTCSFLDIVRGPGRSAIKHSHLQGALDILKAAAKKEISLAVTTTVQTEFNSHLGQIRTELEHYLQNLEAQNDVVIEAIESVGLNYKFSIKGLTGMKLPLKLQSVAEEVFAAAFVLSRDPACDTLAHNRVETGRAPSAKGKSESKDCLIIEHYLALGRQLRATGYNERVVFVTSNSTDYGTPGALKVPLDMELPAEKITYCNNFAWALREAQSPIAP